MTKRGPEPHLAIMDEAATFASGESFSVTWSAGDGTLTSSRAIDGVTFQKTADESIENFAEAMRRLSTTAFKVSGTFTMMAEEYENVRKVLFGIDPAKPADTEEWADSIAPLPDLPGAT